MLSHPWLGRGSSPEQRPGFPLVFYIFTLYKMIISIELQLCHLEVHLTQTRSVQSTSWWFLGAGSFCPLWLCESPLPTDCNLWCYCALKSTSSALGSQIQECWTYSYSPEHSSILALGSLTTCFEQLALVDHFPHFLLGPQRADVL